TLAARPPERTAWRCRVHVPARRRGLQRGIGHDRTTNVAMAVFLIPFSMLAGRIGHARQIGAGVIVAAILALILPFTPTPELLIAVRFLQGVAIASVPATAMAFLSLRLPSQALPGAIGVYIAGNTIGGLCSRLLTGLAAELLGWHGGLAFTAAVSLVFGLI